MADVKKAIFKKKIEGDIYELMVKTGAEHVVMEDGETTLSAYLSEATGSGLTANEMNAAIETAIAALINGAPEALNTLKELADWVESHETLYGGLIGSLANKVDKEAGKGLSTEDFTATLKAKLENLTADMIAETAGKRFVTADEKTKIAESGRILVGMSTPANLTEQDLFIQIVE